MAMKEIYFYVAFLAEIIYNLKHLKFIYSLAENSLNNGKGHILYFYLFMAKPIFNQRQTALNKEIFIGHCIL